MTVLLSILRTFRGRQRRLKQALVLPRPNVPSLRPFLPLSPAPYSPSLSLSLSLLRPPFRDTKIACWAIITEMTFVNNA